MRTSPSAAWCVACAPPCCFSDGLGLAAGITSSLVRLELNHAGVKHHPGAGWQAGRRVSVRGPAFMLA